jgi:predicted flap endonuclease-1-like 5' DNA nuclease
VGFLSFVVGVIVGVIAAWWFFERRDAQSREAMEAGWKKKLDHVEAEVRRADAAHEETKERLRQLQQERLPAPAEKAGAAEPAPTPSPTPAPGPAPVAPDPAESAPPLGEAERTAQARRRIDAKLAQLPAGSSARRRLMAERAALDGGGQEQGEATQKLFTPPPEAPDDLARIRGIGPVLRQQLNKLGITTFAQLAAFSEEDIRRLDEVLDFKGRVAREGWVEQAKTLRDQR